VLWHQPTATNLLFITLRKSEALFNWESQSTTTASSPTGQQRKQGGVTDPFRCLGFAR